MFTSNKQLLLLLNSYLNNIPPKLIIESSDTESWKKLMQAAHIHAVIPMVYDALAKAEDTSLIDASMLKAFRHISISKVAVGVSKAAEFLRVYNNLKENGICPVVIKGSAMAMLYNKSDCRISSDEDILIDENELEALKKALAKLDYELIEVTENESVYHFLNKKTMLSIEAHTRLFMQEGSTEKYSRLFDDKLEYSERGAFRVLDETCELLYLICHAAKHFALSGFGMRQICDIIVLTQRYRETLDFERLLSETKSVGLHIFAATLLKIGEEYLGTEKVPAPFEKYAEDTEPLLCDVLEGGVFGRSSKSRERSVRITLNSVSDNGKNALMTSLFPPFDEMVNIYPKLKNRKMLLPAYWVIRLVKWAAVQGTDSLATLKVGAQRTKLLKRYGLGKEQ